MTWLLLIQTENSHLKQKCRIRRDINTLLTSFQEVLGFLGSMCRVAESIKLLILKSVC